jgi:formylglycine-generating enzyme required for sulfatase activity
MKRLSTSIFIIILTPFAVIFSSPPLCIGAEEIERRFLFEIEPDLIKDKHPEPAEGHVLSIVEGMVFIKGGCFQMGDTSGSGEYYEKPAHEVCVDDFYMGETEVTQRQWVEVMGSNSSYFKGCDDCPVENVSWNNAQEFIDKLNQETTPLVPLNKGGLRGLYRLPTEAEWEYAARSGGKDYRYSWGNGAPSGKNGGNICDESAKRKYIDWAIWNGYDDGFVEMAPVKSFFPNEIGLYDMTGNVWEWCSDWYDINYYKYSPRSNPKGPPKGEYKVLRGGSWDDGPWYVRISNRFWIEPKLKTDDIGFRVVFSYH